MKCRKAVATTVVLMVLLLVVVKYVFTHRNPVEIPLDQLEGILAPGTYEGKGYYSATDIYPGGLNVKLHKVVSRKNGGLSVVTNIKAYDAKTNKFAYDAVREGRFDYKPSHGKEVFINSLSFMDSRSAPGMSEAKFPNENVVSSFHGHSIGKNLNRVAFSSTGTWHISSHNFTHIYNEITKVSPTNIVETFANRNMFEMTLVTMTEDYTKVS